MNYRTIVSFTPEGALTSRIEATHDAATPGSGVYGNIKIARGHFDMQTKRVIDDLQAARREWLTKAEKKLPSDEPALEKKIAE